MSESYGFIRDRFVDLYSDGGESLCFNDHYYTLFCSIDDHLADEVDVEFFVARINHFGSVEQDMLDSDTEWYFYMFDFYDRNMDYWHDFLSCLNEERFIQEVDDFSGIL